MKAKDEKPLEERKARITKKICGLLDVTEEEVLSRKHDRKSKRAKRITGARNTIWFFLHDRKYGCGFKMAGVARAFGRKQSTILHGYNKANGWLVEGEDKSMDGLRNVIAPKRREIMKNDG